MFDIYIMVIISLALVILACGLGYLIYTIYQFVTVKEFEFASQTKLKDDALEQNESLRKETIEAYKSHVKALGDKELLVEIVKMIWDARDTEAASTCVTNLVGPSADGKHYTIGECYAMLRTDLGLDKD